MSGRGRGGGGRGGGGRQRGGGDGGSDPGFVQEREAISMHSMFCQCKSDEEEMPFDESKGEKPPLKVTDVFRVLRMITPFFWPAGETALKVRMAASLMLIVLSKLINLGVPFVMAYIINDLSTNPTTIPVTMIVLYGALRTANSLVTEVQSTVFLNVTQYATRLLSVDAFRHLHNLSLEWHLKRKTGAVLRTINRGTSSIATLIRIVLFTLAPTLLELIMVCVLMTFSYGWGFAGFDMSVLHELDFLIFNFSFLFFSFLFFISFISDHVCLHFLLLCRDFSTHQLEEALSSSAKQFGVRVRRHCSGFVAQFRNCQKVFFFFLEDEFFSEVFIAVSLLKIMKLSAMTCLCAS